LGSGYKSLYITNRGGKFIYSSPLVVGTYTLVKVLDSKSFYTTKINRSIKSTKTNKSLKSTAIKSTSYKKSLIINLSQRIIKSFNLNGTVRNPSVVLLIKIGYSVGPKRPSVEFIKVSKSKSDGVFKEFIKYFGIILLFILSGMFYLFNQDEYSGNSEALATEELDNVDELENHVTDLGDLTDDLIELPVPQDQHTHWVTEVQTDWEDSSTDWEDSSTEFGGLDTTPDPNHRLDKEEPRGNKPKLSIIIPDKHDTDVAPENIPLPPSPVEPESMDDFNSLVRENEELKTQLKAKEEAVAEVQRKWLRFKDSLGI
jgi:hypothetical protein